MVSIKLFIVVVILTSLLCSEIGDAAAKKQRRNIKYKKTTGNGKLKANLKKVSASKVSQRNGKMNYHNSHILPTTTTYYRPASSSSFYRRSVPATSSSLYYPMQWGTSYISPSSFIGSNSLRRTDDIPSSSPLSTAPSPLMTMQSLNNPLISIGNSQMPTLYDMSAFTGNLGLMDHLISSSNQHLWPMEETVAATAKPKLNLFNNFNYNDDGDLFSGFLNQFLK